jgi:hypothetical protein
MKRKGGHPRKQRSAPLPTWPRRKHLAPAPPPPANATMAEIDDHWMRHLPSPRDYQPESDENCSDFMREVMRIGGAKALEWVWVPRVNGTGNWPFSNVARGRMDWFYGQLIDNANRAAQREAEQKAKRLVEAQEDQRRAARRAAGWA